jgi:hypothetical protein
MTLPINQTDGFVQIVATGGETVLDFDFPIFEKAHLTIIRTRESADTTLVLDIDYTIANGELEQASGGEAVLTSGALAADIYTLILSVPEARTTDFNNAGDFFAETLNRELDLQTQQIQGLRRDTDKAARFAASSTLSGATLPDPSNGKILVWDGEDGTIGNLDVTVNSVSTDQYFADVGASGAGNLSYSFSSDTDTGFYRPAPDTMDAVTGNTSRARFSAAPALYGNWDLDGVTTDTLKATAATVNAVYAPETQAIIAAMTTPPSPERVALIDSLARELKAAGVWDKLDLLYVMAAHDAQAARINWKNPAQIATAVNSPTFTVDEGYAGDGSTSYLDSGVNMSTVSNYSQNSAHMGVWSLTNVSDTAYLDCGIIGVNTSTINMRNSSGNMTGGANATTGAVSVAVADSLGHGLVNRSGSTAQQLYKNGASIGSNTQVSSSISPNGNFGIGRRGTVSYSPRQFAFAHFGGSLTAGEVTSLYNAFNAYMGALGVTALQLPPRTTAQKNAIASPTAGMVVFDTDLARTEEYNGTVWRAIGGGVFRNRYTSPNQTITSGGALTLAHGLGVRPFITDFYLECVTAEAGYSIGDIVKANLDSSTTGGNTHGLSVTLDATNINLRYGSAANIVFGTQLRKDNGAHAQFTNANWRLIVEAFA